MELQYLLFDSSDEESGRGSFDAMASVLPARLPALLEEVAAVLRWAHARFGPPDGDDGEWDYELQAQAEPGPPLEIRFDPPRGEVLLQDAGLDARRSVTLTLSGSASFCEALRESFTPNA